MYTHNSTPFSFEPSDGKSNFLCKNFINNVLHLGALLALLAAVSLPSFAQAPQLPPLGVNPLEINLTVARPGGRVTDQFIVSNGGDIPLYVSAYTSDWTLGKSGTIEFQEPGTNPLSCAQWIQIVPAGFSVPPKGEVSVRYTITTPTTLNAEHHALIFFESRPLPAKGTDNMTLLVAARIGSKVFVNPPQPQPIQAKLTGISLLPTADNKLAVTFENTGSSHIRAHGTVEAHDTNGQIVAKGELLPQNVQLLPGTSVELSPKWDKPLAPGTYTIRALVDYGAKTLAGGEVKVEIPTTPPPTATGKPGADITQLPTGTPVSEAGVDPQQTAVAPNIQK